MTTKMNEWGLAQAPAAPAAPMSPTTTALIGAGVGTVAGGLVGHATKKKHTAVGALAGAAVGGAAGYYVGKPAACTGVALASGVMQPLALSLSGQKSASYCAPSGGQVTKVTYATGGVVTGPVATGATGVTLTAQAVGVDNVFVSWTDATGAQQSTSILVTVTA